MKKLFTTLLLSVGIVAISHSQTLTATIGTVSAYPGDSILVPVNVIGFNNIGALTFYIKYDTSALTYESLQNIETNLDGIMTNTNKSVLIIGWTVKGVNGINFDDSHIFDVKFKLKSCPTTLCFDTIKSMAADNTTLTYDKVKWTCGEVTCAVGINEMNIEKHLNVYPNPANSLIVVSFSLIEKSQVDISIYDIFGRKVDRIENGELRIEKGEHKIYYNAGKLRSGVYFVKLESNNNVSVTKFIKN